MIWMIERIREPKARVPVWYLKQDTSGAQAKYENMSAERRPTVKQVFKRKKLQKRWERATHKEKKIIHFTPERSPEGRKYWEGRHVIWLDKGPVVWGEGPSQGHLSQSRDKVGTPEEEEDVVELQADQVFVVNGLSTVEGKKALRVRALLFHGTGCEVLKKRYRLLRYLVYTDTQHWTENPEDFHLIWWSNHNCSLQIRRAGSSSLLRTQKTNSQVIM